MRVEAVNSELRQKLLQQQIHFASLQSALLHSPLLNNFSQAQIMFDRVHSYLHLPNVDEATRIQLLVSRANQSLNKAPGCVHSFTSQQITRATTVVPYTERSIMADASYTYVANTCIAKLPNASVPQVFCAVLGYLGSLKDAMRTHFGVSIDSKVRRSVLFGLCSID